MSTSVLAISSYADTRGLPKSGKRGRGTLLEVNQSLIPRPMTTQIPSSSTLSRQWKTSDSNKVVVKLEEIETRRPENGEIQNI